MKRLFLKIIPICFMYCFSELHSQNIQIKPMESVKQANIGKDKAQVDFISSSADLSFTENSGMTIQQPLRRGDGRYVYTCICDVIDGNRFGFNIGVTGGSSRQELRVYIEDGELKEYMIEIEEVPVSIRDVKVNIEHKPPKIDHVAEIYINSNYHKLSVASNTGEEAKGPTVNANNTFEYIITFDLSTPESREKERELIFTAGRSTYKYSLGILQPKQGQELAVMVITEDYYTNQKNHIRQSFLNGNYLEAYRTYQTLLEKENDENMPDMNADKEEVKKIEQLAKARVMATNLFQKAEAFQGNQMDSAMFYHAEAHKYRYFILKENPSDASCLEENRVYRVFRESAPRVVSGRIVHNTQLDQYSKNKPIGGAYIIVTAHQRDTKKINGIEISVAGKRIEDIPPLQTQSQEDGAFSINVPRNTKDTIYQLNITVDKDVIKKGSDSYTYLPKDSDVESNVVIKIDPKRY